MNDILFYTNRTQEDLITRQLKSFFEFQGHHMTIMDCMSKKAQASFILVDQFFNQKLGSFLIEKIREDNPNSRIFYLSSHHLIEKEEKILQEYHVSILGLPIDEVDIFNRIIS